MKIFNGRIPLLGAVILASTLLSGCPSGGSDTAANNTQATPAAVKVTASLGRFSANTVVNLKKLDGTLLGTGLVIADGTATVKIDAAYTGPVVVEVVGGSNVFYFDEKTGATSNAPFNGTLRSAMPSVQANVGVTALTNAAVAKLGTLATSDASKIQIANAKVAAVFGLTDILTPPNPINGIAQTLDVANTADKYALVLAALAKTATANSGADAALALAQDLGKDDILDAIAGTGSAGASSILTYTPLSSTTGIAAQYLSAAQTYATAASAIIVAATPISITANVSTVTVVSNQSDVTLAKAMFTDLRSTAASLSNTSKTGFMDIQSAAIAADTLANVGPGMEKVASRVATFSFANQAFNNLASWITSGNPETGSATDKGYQSGSIDAVMKGIGEAKYCFAPTTTFTVFSCVSATSTSGVLTSATTGYIKMVLYKLTPAASPSLNNTYSYTATRMNMPMLFAGGIWTPSNVLQVPGTTLPAGKGTLNVQLLASGSVSAFTLNGTLPPSTSNAANTAPLTGVDTVNLALTRTLTTGTTYRIATTGTVATANIDPAITTPNMTITLGTGSFLDSDEANINTTGALATAVKVIGTVQTPATTFTGTVDLTAFTSSADNFERIPTSIVFNGSISNATGTILTGAVTQTIPVADQQAYVANPLTVTVPATNFRHFSTSFTGTIQQPNQPVLSLTLGNARDNYYQWTTAITYAFGTKTITGSSVSLDSPATYTHTNTLSVTNQDGIQFGSVETNNWSTFPSTKTTTATLTKSATSLASSINMTTGVVNYIDGTSATIY